jgi:hypothetical protein
MRDRGAPLKLDSRPMQHREEGHAFGRERLDAEPEVRRSGSLEGRLSEKYDERFIEPPPRQTHALPPNPALHHGHNPMHSETHWKDNRQGSFAGPPIRPGWSEARDVPSHRSNEAPPSQRFNNQSRDDADMRSSRPQRPRKSQSTPQPPHIPGDGPLRMDIDISSSHPSQEFDAHRPGISRRGGSLLDRLSLDQNGDTPVDGPSQSLRDRVQVPSKRDREEMSDNRDFPTFFDASYEEDYDPNVYDPNKRPRRRSGKVRKVRRGGGP